MELFAEVGHAKEDDAVTRLPDASVTLSPSAMAIVPNPAANSPIRNS
jgi:hypothetical protein